MSRKSKLSKIFATAAVVLGICVAPIAAKAGEVIKRTSVAQMTGMSDSGVSGTGASEATAVNCQERASLRVAQTELQAPSSKSLQLRAPSGEKYVQMPGQRQFTKLKAGTSLGSLDCVEVHCPASFPPDATCWRCVEQIKAPEN